MCHIAAPIPHDGGNEPRSACRFEDEKKHGGEEEILAPMLHSSTTSSFPIARRARVQPRR
jgi:hypothetical protein